MNAPMRLALADTPFPWSERDVIIVNRLTAILRAAHLPVEGTLDVEQGLDVRVQTRGGTATVRCRCGRRGLLAEVEPVDEPGDAPHARSFLGQALTDWALTQIAPDDWLAQDYCWVDVVNAHLGSP